MTAVDSQLMLEALACFLVGSIPFAVVAMIGSGIDIRTVGSGNPGFNNVLRVDKKRAVLTLIGDMLKGYFPLLAFYQPTSDPLFHGWLFGFAAVFGHCYSPWLRFNGGKGIATSAGVMLRLYPSFAVLGLAFFVVVRVLGSRRRWPEAGTFASVGAWVFFTLMLFLYQGEFTTRMSLLMTAFLAWRHRSNFRRLIASVRTAGGQEGP